MHKSRKKLAENKQWNVHCVILKDGKSRGKRGDILPIEKKKVGRER